MAALRPSAPERRSGLQSSPAWTPPHLLSELPRTRAEASRLPTLSAKRKGRHQAGLAEARFRGSCHVAAPGFLLPRSASPSRFTRCLFSLPRGKHSCGSTWLTEPNTWASQGRTGISPLTSRRLRPTQVMCLEPIMVAWTQKGALIGWGPSHMSVSEPITVIKNRDF